MLLGIFLKFSNAVYDRSAVDFFFECIPQVVIGHFILCSESGIGLYYFNYYYYRAGLGPSYRPCRDCRS